jgi:hypothetical protein
VTRGLTSPAQAIVTAEIPGRTVAVELDFPTGMVRMNGSPVDMTIGGAVFYGVGGLGSISVVEESAELRSYDLTIGLSGVPRDSVALAMTQQYQGRAAAVYEVPLNAAGQPVDPFVIFRGRMDQMAVELGETATVQVTLRNRLADWERPRVLLYTDEDQQRLYPGDLGMQFVPATAEKQLVWPAASWWDKQR